MQISRVDMISSLLPSLKLKQRMFKYVTKKKLRKKESTLELQMFQIENQRKLAIIA